jgi:hypothetical protein
MSPSGRFLGSLYDAGHSNVALVEWSFDDPHDGTVDKDKLTRYGNTNQTEWNAWHADDPEICCNGVCVGIGATHPRWSRNSDKWYILDLGWRHRFAGCGRNQILVNWQDSISINVSRNNRSCSELEGEGCANFVKDEFEQNYAGDFLVQSPIDDVNEDLRQYLDVSYARRQSNMNPFVKGAQNSASAAVRICNARGETVKAASLPAGVYFIQMFEARRVFTKRIVVKK